MDTALAFEGMLFLVVLLVIGVDLVMTRRSVKRDKDRKARDAAATSGEARHAEGE